MSQIVKKRPISQC